MYDSYSRKRFYQLASYALTVESSENYLNFSSLPSPPPPSKGKRTGVRRRWKTTRRKLQLHTAFRPNFLQSPSSWIWGGWRSKLNRRVMGPRKAAQYIMRLLLTPWFSQTFVILCRVSYISQNICTNSEVEGFFWQRHYRRRKEEEKPSTNCRVHGYTINRSYWGMILFFADQHWLQFLRGCKQSFCFQVPISFWALSTLGQWTLE